MTLPSVTIVRRLKATPARVYAALNCLTTVQQVLRQDRSRIRLPSSMIRARLAEVAAR